MRPPYRLELFDRSLNFRAATIIEEPEIYFDQLTLEGVQIASPPVRVEKGDFAHIVDSGGGTVYQGIVSDIQMEATYTLDLLPLLSLFDLTVTYNRVDLQTGALEDFIAGIISELYVTGPDTLQHIPMTVQTTSSTTSALNIKSNVHEFYDIITKAFTMYSVRVDAVFLPGEGTIAVTVGRVTAPERVIEAHLDNILERSIVIGDNYGQANKLTLINKHDETERVTYYLHTDGKVDTSDTDRVLPVFPAVEYVESEQFAEDAQARAREQLLSQQYDNLIELTCHQDDRIIQPDTIQIGTSVRVIDEERVYSTILTGYERRGPLVKLIMGNVRVDLTKKMILERRRNI